MSNWKRTDKELPMVDREILAMNTEKVIEQGSARKCSKTMKFANSFTKGDIKAALENDKITYWAYVELAVNDGYEGALVLSELLNEIVEHKYTDLSQVIGHIHNCIDEWKVSVDGGEL